MAVNTNFGPWIWRYFLLFEMQQKQESQGELLLSGGRLCFCCLLHKGLMELISIFSSIVVQLLCISNHLLLLLGLL
jgi:hypothetical protein